VTAYGVTVKKQSPDMVAVVSIYSPGNSYDEVYLSNYTTINVVDQLSRVPGVGSTTIVGQRDYAMRVWARPDKLAKLGLTATDIEAAIQDQNVQAPAGALGQPPAPTGTDFQYTVTAPGRLVDPSQFEDIVLRARPDTGLLRIRDVGHAQLGALSYSGFSRVSGVPSGNLIVYLSPGANAVATADRVRKFMAQAKRGFPTGMDYVIPYDSSVFVRAAIKEVMMTLFEATGLVIVVVFLFLQNWRATLIPLLTVPVAIVGTFALFPLLGFSINMTSMFGLVLAIGIVVDDAIVVVEAAQRHIDEGLGARDAAIRAMEEVSAPVVATAVTAAAMAAAAAASAISGECALIVRFMSGVAGVALPIPRFVSLEVVEGLVSALRQRSMVTVVRVIAVVDVAVEAAMAVEPGAGSDKDSTNKPVRAIVAVGSAVVGRVVEVPVRAVRRRTDVDAYGDLRRRLG